LHHAAPLLHCPGRRQAAARSAVFSLPKPVTQRHGTKRRIFAVANEKSQNVQDVFLNHVRKNKTPVTIFLVNGVKLQGIITWFDNFSVLLRRDGHTQLVYKHAISTVMPGAPIQLFDASRTEATSGAAPGAATGALRETVAADS
jgi:host factor-I protein